MFSRRRLLFLLGGTTAGIWLASTGLIRLEHTFVLKHAGHCSFCGKAADEVLAIVGVPGRPCQICDECMELCCDILERFEVRIAPHVLDAQRAAQQGRLAARKRQDAEAHPCPPELRRLLDEYRQRELLARLLESRKQSRSHDVPPVERPSWSAPVEFSCSFCDKPRSAVAKLISGPYVFICDGCTGEAVGILNHVLRA